MHANSSYVVTDPRTNTQTDRGDYNTLCRSLARSVIAMAVSNPTRTGDVIRQLVRFGELSPAVGIYVIETRTEREKCAYTLRLSDKLNRFT